MDGRTRLAAMVAVVGALIGAGPPVAGSHGTNPEPRVEIVGARPDQVRLVHWAVDRFDSARLEVPALQVRFHSDGTAGCEGALGYAKAAGIDMCAKHVDALSRGTLVHEMSHLWLDANVSAAVRGRFLRLRGLDAWNDPSEPWPLRGYEQGAEVISWEIGERVYMPGIPDNGASDMAVAFELLTGRRPPQVLP